MRRNPYAFNSIFVNGKWVRDNSFESTTRSKSDSKKDLIRLWLERRPS